MVIKTANILHTGIVFFFLTASAFAESSNERADGLYRTVPDGLDAILRRSSGRLELCGDGTVPIITALGIAHASNPHQPTQPSLIVMHGPTSAFTRLLSDGSSNGAFGSPLSLP